MTENSEFNYIVIIADTIEDARLHFAGLERKGRLFELMVELVNKTTPKIFSLDAVSIHFY
jgi:hypothetical protein